MRRLIALAATAPLVAAAADVAKVQVTGTQGAIRTGAPIALRIITPARSPGGTPAQPPMAWIDHEDTLTPDGAVCAARAERLGQTGATGITAARDFNSVHVATLSRTGGLHVLDPRNGIRGARSLAYLELGSDPADWLWQPDHGLIWVALPDRQEVVAVDVGRWRIVQRHTGLDAVTTLAAMADGGIVALAPGIGAVAIVAGRASPITGTAKANAVVPVGGNGFWLLEDDELTLHGTGVTRHIPVALRRASWSDRADRLIGLTTTGGLVTIGRDGRVLQVDGAHTVSALDRLWLGPDGDVAVAWTPGGRELVVIDLAAGRVARSIAVDRPLALAASRSFLFVRTAGRGETMVLPIATLSASGAGPRWIAGGNPPVGATAPLAATDEGLSAWIAPEANGGLVYFYHEGMNIPSGTLRYPGEAPDRLLLVGSLVRKVAPGRFAADFLLERPGRYVAVAAGAQPRYVVCTPFTVAGPALLSPDEQTVDIRLIDGPTRAKPGEPVTVRFALDGEAAKPATIGLLVMDVSGTGPQRHIIAQAAADANGYQATLRFAAPGAYMVLPDPVTLPARAAGRPVLTLTVEP